MRLKRDDSGVSMVLIALMIVGLLAMAALVVDFGNAAQRKREAQAASDNSALAAVQDLPATATAKTTAARYAASNLQTTSFGTGTPCGTNATCYTSPPWSLTVTTPYEGDSRKVQTKVCRGVPTTFAGVLGISTINICTTSAARFHSPIIGPDILVTAKTVQKSFTCSGSCNVNAGSVVVDSSDSTALNVSGSGHVTADTIGVVGVPGSPPSGLTCNLGPPCPSTGASVFVDDPYASLATTAPITQASVQSQYGTGSCTTVSNTTTCTPGVYTTTPTVSGGKTGVFLPGIYYLTKGLTISASPATGSGVLFYNASGSFNVTGGSGSVNFSPLNDDSSYGGFVLYQPTSNGSTSTFSGGSASTVPGILYNGGGLMTYTGGSGCGSGSGVAQVVSKTLTVSGPSCIGAGVAGFNIPGTIELFE